MSRETRGNCGTCARIYTCACRYWRRTISIKYINVLSSFEFRRLRDDGEKRSNFRQLINQRILIISPTCRISLAGIEDSCPPDGKAIVIFFFFFFYIETVPIISLISITDIAMPLYSCRCNSLAPRCLWQSTLVELNREKEVSLPSILLLHFHHLPGNVLSLPSS